MYPNLGYRRERYCPCRSLPLVRRRDGNARIPMIVDSGLSGLGPVAITQRRMTEEWPAALSHLRASGNRRLSIGTLNPSFESIKVFSSFPEKIEFLLVLLSRDPHRIFFDTREYEQILEYPLDMVSQVLRYPRDLVAIETVLPVTLEFFDSLGRMIRSGGGSRSQLQDDILYVAANFALILSMYLPDTCRFILQLIDSMWQMTNYDRRSIEIIINVMQPNARAVLADFLDMEFRTTGSLLAREALFILKDVDRFSVDSLLNGLALT
jgi:hypothetical protein